MRKATSIAMVLLFLLATSPGPALADSPHFVSATASIDTSNGDLTVSFKEAGLGSAVTVNYDFTAEATADYGCVNGGGNHPQATNKDTVAGPVTGTATFTSTKAGNITGSFSTEPPPLPSGFSCPSGQTLVLADVTYSDITLNDTTNGVSASIPGSVSAVFFTFKK